MNFTLKLITTLSIPAVSFLPAGLISVNQTNLKWATKYICPAINFNVISKEYMQPRPRSGLRMWQWKKQGGSGYDVAMGGLSTGMIVHEHNHAITSLPFKLNIKGTLSSDQTSKLYDGETILLKDTNATIINRDDILQHFWHTTPDQNKIKNDEDWYVNPQNHQGSSQGDWGFRDQGSEGNPTNMYDMDCGGSWLDNGGVWTDRCQGLRRSDKGSNGTFKCWEWNRDPHRVWGYWPSCNANNDSTKDFLAKEWWYHDSSGNWRKNSGVEQSQQVYNYVVDELYNDSKNLNVNKWFSWDDKGYTVLSGFYFCYKNFFDCISVSMDKQIVPPKEIKWTLNFKYDSSRLAGKNPFSFYFFNYDPGQDVYNGRQIIHCFHPTSNDFGGICTQNYGGQMEQRGTMVGIYDSYSYGGTTVNPSTYTWSCSGSWDIKNPLIEE